MTGLDIPMWLYVNSLCNSVGFELWIFSCINALFLGHFVSVSKPSDISHVRSRRCICSPARIVSYRKPPSFIWRRMWRADWMTHKLQHSLLPRLSDRTLVLYIFYACCFIVYWFHDQVCSTGRRFRDGSDLHSVICLLYRVHHISTPPHDLLLLTQQRFKIILKYFMWLLVTMFCLSVAIIVQ